MDKDKDTYPYKDTTTFQHLNYVSNEEAYDKLFNN